MPTDLGRPYSLDWRGDPPHMLKPDIPIWYRFLALYGAPFLNLFYDCSLGGPPLPPGGFVDPLEKMWQRLLVKRADAIAELDDEVWIIEVSADPGLRAIGQLQSYRVLWFRDPKILKPERLLLVSETIEEDLLDVASTYGIQCYIL